MLVAPGIYSGELNKWLTFRGKDLVLISEAGPTETVVEVWPPGSEEIAMFLQDGEARDAIVDGFTFRASLDEFGQGILLFCSATIRDCIFVDLVGGDLRGCVEASIRGTPLIENCVMSSPGQTGIWVDRGAGAEIRNCHIFRCSGGIYCSGGGLVMVRDCVIEGNEHLGIELNTSHEVQVINCLVTRNIGIGIGANYASVVGCTITANGGTEGTGGLYNAFATRVENSIIYGNCGYPNTDITAGGPLTLVCCAYPENGTGIFHSGSIHPVGPQVHQDPRFCDPWPCPEMWEHDPGGTYTLRSDSPCLAAFSPCQTLIGARDLECQAPEPVGACCVQDTTCVLTTLTECDRQHGMFKGDGVSCYPHGCAALPTEVTTWGRIKNRFR